MEIRFAVSCKDDFPLLPDMTATLQAVGTRNSPKKGFADLIFSSPYR